jgi:hypothetical protein
MVMLCAAASCARPLPPPGGEEDRSPPQIVATTPEPLQILEGFSGEVVFRFDERISERGTENIVLVTPVTGDVRISRGRSEIRARVEGGWRPGVIYRVVLLPGIRDLFNNERRTPADLVFSTGPEIPATAIAGLVTDRITGRPASQAIVQATRRTDSLPYITAVDSQAFFALQNLPFGLYDVIAFTDVNRNRRRDPSEAVSAAATAPLSQQTDTLPIDLVVIPPDTTPARLLRAEARDSLQVRIFTDDWIEPALPLVSLQIRILQLPDSSEIEGPHRAIHVDSFMVARAKADSAARADSLARMARADSIARAARADSLRRAGADTAAVDTTRRQPPLRGAPTIPPRVAQPRGAQQRPGGAQADALPPIGPLPYQELVIVPARALPPGRYLIEVRGLQNIAQIPGGGGMVAFEIAAPRPTRRDTTDTGGVRATSATTHTAESAVALRILPRRQ